MRVCPKCGFVEEIEWHPTTWKSAQYIDCCRLSDFRNLNPELAKKLENFDTHIEGYYAYRLTKHKIWVLRRWIELYKIQKWKEIPAEQHKKGKPQDASQTRLEVQL